MKKVVLLLGLLIFNLSIYLNILAMKKQAIIDGRLRDITRYNYFDEDDKIEKSIDIIEDLKESEKPKTKESRKKSTCCERCKKLFYSKANLKVHIEVVHKKIKKFRCGQCNRAFGYHSSLKYHIKKEHENRKNTEDWTCQICLKSLSCRSSLQRHIKRMHNEVNLYVCQLCNLKFEQEHNCVKHKQYYKISLELEEEELDNTENNK